MPGGGDFHMAFSFRLCNDLSGRRSRDGRHPIVGAYGKLQLQRRLRTAMIRHFNSIFGTVNMYSGKNWDWQEKKLIWVQRQERFL
jgi:hypothetical protein